MSFKSNLKDVPGTLKRQTPLAWLVVSDFTGKEGWVPKSVGELEPEDATDGESVTITLPSNMAAEKELI